MLLLDCEGTRLPLELSRFGDCHQDVYGSINTKMGYMRESSSLFLKGMERKTKGDFAHPVLQEIVLAKTRHSNPHQCVR
jgi:hypothetical protein